MSILENAVGQMDSGTLAARARAREDRPGRSANLQGLPCKLWGLNRQVNPENTNRIVEMPLYQN